MRTYIHTHIDKYIHTYIYTYIHGHIHTHGNAHGPFYDFLAHCQLRTGGKGCAPGTSSEVPFKEDDH